MGLSKEQAGCVPSFRCNASSRKPTCGRSYLCT